MNNNSMRKYFSKVKGRIIIIAIIILIISVTDIFRPIIEANLLTSITELNYKMAIWFSVFYILYAINNIVLNHLNNKIYMGTKEKLLYYLRKDILDRIFSLKVVNFDKISSGEFQQKLRDDPASISRILSVVQYNAFAVVTNLVILIYVFFLNYILGIIYLVGVVSVYFIEKKLYKRYETLRKDYSKIQDKNTTILNEIMHGIRDIKLLNIVPSISNIASTSMSQSNKYDTKLKMQHDNIWKLSKTIEYLTTFLVIFVGIYLASNNYLSVTNLIIIYMYRYEIFSLIFNINTVKEYYTEYKVARDRIFSIMDDNYFPVEQYGDVKLKNINGSIEFRNVSFGYNEKLVLKDINFTIEANDTVAIVGASGSGKSTIFNLLNKSYDISDNSIFIDGVDINTLDRNSIRNNISIISQNPYLFNFSIKENFMLLGDNIKMKDIKEACRLAKIDDFIDSLPDKYDTILGEGGVNLSGGQKQRIAIARALLKKSKIILFDEATSALDNITQREIQESISSISKDYTILIIAHRLSTIKDCNKIMVVHDGKIAGVGTHYELLKDNPYYQELYNNEIQLS